MSLLNDEAKLYVFTGIDHDFMSNADTSTRALVINLGIHMYRNIPKHELIVHNSNDDISLKRKEYTIETLRDENQHLREKQEKSNDHLQQELEILKQAYEERLSNTQEQLLFFKKQNEVNNKFSEYVEGLTSKKIAYQLGVEGEGKVEQFLGNYFEEGQLMNTAQTTLYIEVCEY